MTSESERASTSYDETLSREIASELRCSTSARRETFEKIREVERLLRGARDGTDDTERAMWKRTRRRFVSSTLERSVMNPN